MSEKLPIYEIENDIIQILRREKRLILSAPTGSGKSTQVPQMLLRHGLAGEGQIVVLQPRRLAARMLASRVAQEFGCRLGGVVGYQIRFENVTSSQTRIRFVTEGILLRQIISDPFLKGVSAILFDEFHERHLYGDITLARALDLQEKARPDLILAVMSATIDSDQLEKYLHPCATLSSVGRTFPVVINNADQPAYLDSRPVWDQAAGAFSDYVRSGGEGDVLIFMPGGYEISQTLEAVRQTSESKGFVLLPLHGELSPEDQDKAVNRYSQRKVVVATNVAETSLTIDGVRLVIDSGLARISRYDPHRGINTLFVEKISQASADQRAGRAGRTAPGACHRLWTSKEHQERKAQELPEIKRLDLSEVVLTLKAAGINDLKNFRWLDAPTDRSLADAEELLLDLGALQNQAVDGEDSGTVSVISELGLKMLQFPLHPRYSRLMLAGQENNCVYQAALMAALTQGRDLLLRNVDRHTEDLRADLFGEKETSDFWILMRAWEYAAKNQYRIEACRKLGIHALTARQVTPLLETFLQIARKEGMNTDPVEVPDEVLQKCILTAFSDRVARRVDQGTLRCDLVHRRQGVLARESTVRHSNLIVVAELREVEGRDKTANLILSLATEISSEWLRELYPSDFKTELELQYDSSARRVYADEKIIFRGLPVLSKRKEPPPLDGAAKLLAEEVLAGRLILTGWNHAVDQWILRLNLLAKACPDLGLSPLGPAEKREVIEQLCHGAFSYKDIKDKPVQPVIKGWLNAEQQFLLDKHVPERISLTNGKTPKVIYPDDGNAPYISLRIQELYGVDETVKVAKGRIAVVVHILAPNMRPIQITKDLESFWREQYPKARQELQRKYPRHEWR